MFQAGTEEAEAAVLALQAETEGQLITIDFTHPTAVNGNVEFYAKLGMVRAPLTTPLTSSSRPLVD